MANINYVPGRVDPNLLTEKFMHTVLYVGVHNRGSDVNLLNILDGSVSLRNDRLHVIHICRDLGFCHNPGSVNQSVV